MLVRLLIALILLAPAAHGAEVRVLAAASLTNALEDAARTWEQHGGGKVVLNLGGSSTLARQIEHGAPCDLFVSADEAKVAALARSGLIEASTRRVLLSNTLVVVVRNDLRDVPSRAEDLTRLRRLALAEPATVPAGIYARRWLERKGLWPALSRRIIPTDNVRAALAAVAGGNADAAIVYRTDVVTSRNVRIAFHVPRAETPDIVYVAAIPRASGNKAAARKFLAFLSSPAAARIFRKHGFLVSAKP